MHLSGPLRVSSNGFTRFARLVKRASAVPAGVPPLAAAESAEMHTTPAPQATPAAETPKPATPTPSTSPPPSPTTSTSFERVGEHVTTIASGSPLLQLPIPTIISNLTRDIRSSITVSIPAPTITGTSMSYAPHISMTNSAALETITEQPSSFDPVSRPITFAESATSTITGGIAGGIVGVVLFYFIMVSLIRRCQRSRNKDVFTDEPFQASHFRRSASTLKSNYKTGRDSSNYGIMPRPPSVIERHVVHTQSRSPQLQYSSFRQQDTSIIPDRPPLAIQWTQAHCHQSPPCHRNAEGLERTEYSNFHSARTADMPQRQGSVSSAVHVGQRSDDKGDGTRSRSRSLIAQVPVYRGGDSTAPQGGGVGVAVAARPDKVHVRDDVHLRDQSQPRPRPDTVYTLTAYDPDDAYGGI
ncbi:hypothetical protein FISHEDRAFT_70248 [Fistulina hepatica ATCC 64428]|uniref:Mid2 domain-containing protein n=1 Tax=Fistulina hepatica ATCC 64428 TaxID=1128425 RepID=A0A0D7AJS1_9AGAR|nr:hypothetical protein FISHEDRAFT_70248 [Fistulina hepatica ATCC 64428]